MERLSGLCLLAASAGRRPDAGEAGRRDDDQEDASRVTLKTETQSVSGTVKEYEAGK